MLFTPFGKSNVSASETFISSGVITQLVSSPSPSTTPTPTPSATSSPVSTPTPTSAPNPTPKPTASPTPKPTATPTPKPTATPTPITHSGTNYALMPSYWTVDSSHPWATVDYSNLAPSGNPSIKIQSIPTLPTYLPGDTEIEMSGPPGGSKDGYSWGGGFVGGIPLGAHIYFSCYMKTGVSSKYTNTQYMDTRTNAHTGAWIGIDVLFSDGTGGGFHPTDSESPSTYQVPFGNNWTQKFFNVTLPSTITCIGEYGPRAGQTITDVPTAISFWIYVTPCFPPNDESATVPCWFGDAQLFINP